MTLLGLLLALVVIGLIWWAIVALVAAFGIPEPIATVIKVIFVVGVVLWLLSFFGLMPAMRLR